LTINTDYKLNSIEIEKCNDKPESRTSSERSNRQYADSGGMGGAVKKQIDTLSAEATEILKTTI